MAKKLIKGGKKFDQKPNKGVKKLDPKSKKIKKVKKTNKWPLWLFIKINGCIFKICFKKYSQHLRTLLNFLILWSSIFYVWGLIFKHSNRSLFSFILILSTYCSRSITNYLFGLFCLNY